MMICLIGLGIIFLFFVFYMFTVLATKKYKIYRNKIWELEQDIGTEKETILTHNNLEFYEKKKRFWSKFDDFRDFNNLGAIFSLVSVAIIMAIFIIFTGFKSEGKRDYEEYLLVKETIEYCIDNDITLDNSMLEKTIRINKEINRHKQDKQNPWLSWFVYNDICNINEINLDSFK